VIEGREPIRSYQRIFRPERRIYQLEGRALPVPGGVPLRWLAYATAALLAVLTIGSGSSAVLVLAAGGAALAGLFVGGRAGAALAGVTALGAIWLAGVALGLLDWPLRLLVLPVAVATLATQATPDGRNADRFAASWFALRLAPRRRSLGRAMPPPGAARLRDVALWVAPDEHAPGLRRARVHGTGAICFAGEVRARRVGLRRRRLVVRAASGHGRRGELITTRLAVGEGEVLEVRS
jgi:hypothetical protein